MPVNYEISKYHLISLPEVEQTENPIVDEPQ